MMTIDDRLIALLRDNHCGEEEIAPENDLYEDLGIWGDDAAELLEKYRETFGVSLIGFDFGEHFPGEGVPLSSPFSWNKPRGYLPLTVADLQRGIEQKYLGRDPATVETMHAPLAPGEEDRVEAAVYRLKNRLMFRPFFFIALLSVALNALCLWVLVSIVDRGAGEVYHWLTAIVVIGVVPWIAMEAFVGTRCRLLKFPRGTEVWYRAWGAWKMIVSVILPVMIPTWLIFRYLEDYRGRLLVWAAVFFAGGLLAFLAFIHTYPFDARKLKEYARGKGIDIRALKLKP
jgi:hypothetical protein